MDDDKDDDPDEDDLDDLAEDDFDDEFDVEDDFDDEDDLDEDDDPADGYRGAEDRSADSRMSRATGSLTPRNTAPAGGRASLDGPRWPTGAQ